MFQFITNKIFIANIIILIPFLNFLNSNVSTLDYVIYNQVLIYLIITISVFLVVSRFVSYLFFKKIDFINLYKIFAIGFYLLFQFKILKNIFFENFGRDYDSYLSLISLSLIFIIVILIYYYKKVILIRFISIYFLFFFIFILFNYSTQIIKNYFFKINISNDQRLAYFNEEEIDEINNVNKKKLKNIYFVILDEATSLEKYSSYFNKDITEIKKNLHNLGLTYIPNTFSSNDSTPFTLASMFNLNPIINEKTKNAWESPDLFPFLISKSALLKKDKPNLLLTLDKINYDFIWVGNHYGDCDFYNSDYCLYKKPFNNIVDRLFRTNYYILDSFFFNTPIKTFYSYLLGKDQRVILNNEYGDIYYENDAIGKFLDNIDSLDGKNSKKYFFFIHHMMPHGPNIYNNDCSRRKEYWDQNLEENSEDYQVGYALSYECMFKKIDDLMLYVNLNDPNAIVIFQGDHGRYFAEEASIDGGKNFDKFQQKYSKKNMIDRLSILSLFKVNSECKNFLSNKLDNVNAPRLALSCATNQKIKLIENKNYYASSFKEDYGKVYEYKND